MLSAAGAEKAPHVVFARPLALTECLCVCKRAATRGKVSCLSHAYSVQKKCGTIIPQQVCTPSQRPYMNPPAPLLIPDKWDNVSELTKARQGREGLGVKASLT